MTVMGVAKQLGISLTDCAAALKTASGVKGRVEAVSYTHLKTATHMSC